MAEFLVVRLPAAADAPAEWIAVEASGARRGPPVTGPLEEAAADVRDRRIIVLVPGTDVLTTSVDVPVKGGSRLQAALPYALEEHLAEDVETLHFAAGTRRVSGKVPAAVVSREKLAEWLARLSAAGISPWAVVPENYGLARIPGTISLLVAENQVMINDGADVELVMQDVSPGDALAAMGALDEGEREDAESIAVGPGVPRHALVYCEPGEDERYRHDWIAMREALETVDVNLLPDGVTPRLAVTVATGAGVNLLQGEFGNKTEYAGIFRRWRIAAMLVVGLVAAGVLAKGTNLYLLHRQESALREQFIAEYRKVVPGAGDVQDPVAVVTSLRARTGRTDVPPLFLQSLEDLSRALSAHGEARIESLRYGGGVIDVRLTAPNVTMLDNIQRMIRERGRFTASIQGTTQQGERVSSQIRIEEAGA
ncbi:MAG TPA: type II secretion system protein GspL [Woeseiaceae bacterium]|nr:type II secretion system protein GspL [Woeseiaceae bacterium]